MTVSQAAISTSLLPGSVAPARPTPFWELEELIRSGFERDQALNVMLVRRGELPSMPVTALPARQDHKLLTEI